MSGGARHIVERTSSWTEERLAFAIERRKQGYSCGQIAKDLGITRNAVIGKLQRHCGNIPKAAAPSRYIGRGRRGAAELARALADSSAPTVIARPRRVIHASPIISPLRLAPMPPTPTGKMLDSSAAKPWTERLFAECSYPVDGEGADTRSCCLPTGGPTYCAGHRAIMYAKPTTEAQRAALAKARAVKAMRRAA
jgi:GcrA cell cycle regulator